MKHTTALALVAALSADLASAAPSTASAAAVANSNAKPAAVRAPCGQISDLWANRGSARTISVKATLALACYQSIPFRQQDALKLLDSLRPYMDWQSDTPWKANPPADYSFAAVDVYTNFDTIRANAANNRYASEYDFQSDLQTKIFGPAHDGHMAFFPDTLTRAMQFGRATSLVSISSDGNTVPQVKFAADVKSQGDAALAVTKLNGKAIADALLDETRAGSGSQDIDAGYNNLFASLAQSAAGNGGSGEHASGGRGAFVYQGQWSNYTMSDGTVRSVENGAIVYGDFSKINNGSDFYARFADPLWNQKHASTAGKGADPPAVTQLNGYPKPVVISRDGVVSGYYLNGDGYENTAVLTMLSFEPKAMTEFQDTVTSFFNQAVQDGKTSLILDVQANGGGFIFLGFDLFRQLFPDTIQEGDSRWKATKAFNGVAHVYSDYEDAHPNSVKGDSFTWQGDFNSTNQPFTSFADKFGPNTIRNTPYTNTMRYNFDYYANNGGFNVTGYGNRTNFTQPFAPENIVLLYDGYCASTCTIASELLRQQGGVKSVAFGGRPTRDAMQGVGGVKGSQILSFDGIFSYIKDGKSLSTSKSDQAEFARYNDLAINRTRAAGMNVRDAIIRGHQQDGTPAQFVYEAADCRKYWTKEMLSDPTAIWKATADSAFGGAGCVNGAISRRSEEARSVHASYVAPAAAKPIDAATGHVQGGDYAPTKLSSDFLEKFLQKVPTLPVLPKVQLA